MNIFKRKTRFKIDGRLTIEEAFTLKGKKYYCCATATDLAAGRGLSAMIIYDEFRMKCSKEYLELHIEATELLLKGKDGVIGLDHLLALKQINQNLKERINLVAMPEHVYKLASVYYWDESESPYMYDHVYNAKKIEEWKKDPEVLSFFLSGPLKEFLPFFESQGMSANSFLEIAEMEGTRQREKLHRIVSNLQ